MIDLESMVKDILETEYSIEEKIENCVPAKVAEMVAQWMRMHDFDSAVEEAVELELSADTVADAIELAIDEFVTDVL